MTIGGESGANPVWIGLICCALLVFGYGYNQLVAWMEKQKYMEGFTSIIVAFGVAAVLFGLLLIDAVAAVVTLLLFACAGGPMIAGSIWRYVRRRKAEQDALRAIAEGKDD